VQTAADRRASRGAAHDPRQRAGLRVRLARAFTERLALKSTAVGLAIILWFIIIVKEPTGEWVPATLEPVLDSSLVLQSRVRDPLVYVVGAPADLLKARARRLIIRPHISAASPDTLVVNLRASDIEVPDGLRVEAIDPVSVRLEFAPTWSRRVPVSAQVRVEVTPGTVAPSIIVDPEWVEITGPRLSVLQTMFVRTEAVTLSADDSLAHLVGIDTSGLTVRARPMQVKVRLQTARDTVPRPRVPNGIGGI
jgi:hypothetical protein